MIITFWPFGVGDECSSIMGISCGRLERWNLTPRLLRLDARRTDHFLQAVAVFVDEPLKALRRAWARHRPLRCETSGGFGLRQYPRDLAIHLRDDRAGRF